MKPVTGEATYLAARWASRIGQCHAVFQNSRMQHFCAPTRGRPQGQGEGQAAGAPGRRILRTAAAAWTRKRSGRACRRRRTGGRRTRRGCRGGSGCRRTPAPGGPPGRASGPAWTLPPAPPAAHSATRTHRWPPGEGVTPTPWRHQHQVVRSLDGRLDGRQHTAELACSGCVQAHADLVIFVICCIYNAPCVAVSLLLPRVAPKSTVRAS